LDSDSPDRILLDEFFLSPVLLYQLEQVASREVLGDDTKRVRELIKERVLIADDESAIEAG
jgi:hypothetical protein